MAEEDEGAIGADWDMRAEGAIWSEGAMRAEGGEGVSGAEEAEEDEGAAMYILLDGYDTMGIGYIALWSFGAKCWLEWSG